MIMFFEPGNPDDLARCIVELANDKERQQSLTENGRRFSEINNWNDKQKVYYSILENLTGQSTATVPSLLNTKTRRKTNRVPIIQNADRPVVVLSTHNTGLGLIRSIGEAGLPVVAVYYDKNDMGYVSKYVVERVFTAHPEESEKQFIDTLVDLADRYGEGLLVPADDATLVTVSKNKDLLKQHYTVACTEWDTAQRFIDKKYTYELASSVGVPIPKTIVPKNINEAREYAESVDYPCLVKPCQSHLYHQLFRRKMRKVNNPEELISAYREASSAGLEVMLHEYIPGEDTEGVNYNSYCWDNQVLVEFTASKVRLSPPDSGVPAVVESKHIPEVAEYGRRVLKAMGYYGYSCTEFKRDTRDGVYKLMEVNGRHNRSLRLSVKCGINFPLIEYNHLVRGQLPKTADFRDGVFWIDVGGDLYCSFQYKRKRKLSLIDYLRPYVKPHIFAVLDLRDPMPIMKRLLNAPKSIFEKVFMH